LTLGLAIAGLTGCSTQKAQSAAPVAVPVTASYIICAVIAAPALIKLGVPDYAAHMFIFYYAVLSEVSPPTALSKRWWRRRKGTWQRRRRSWRKRRPTRRATPS